MLQLDLPYMLYTTKCSLRSPTMKSSQSLETCCNWMELLPCYFLPLLWFCIPKTRSHPRYMLQLNDIIHGSNQWSLINCRNKFMNQWSCIGYTTRQFLGKYHTMCRKSKCFCLLLLIEGYRVDYTFRYACLSKYAYILIY